MGNTRFSGQPIGVNLGESEVDGLPSGKHSHNYGKSPFLTGKCIMNGHFQ